MTSFRFLRERIGRWPLARLKLSERNPWRHSEHQVVRLAASLVEQGWLLSRGRSSGSWRSPRMVS